MSIINIAKKLQLKILQKKNLKNVFLYLLTLHQHNNLSPSSLYDVRQKSRGTSSQKYKCTGVKKSRGPQPDSLQTMVHSDQPPGPLGPTHHATWSSLTPPHEMFHVKKIFL